MKFHKSYLIVALVLFSISCKKDKKSKSEIVMDYPFVVPWVMDVALDTLPVDSFIIRETVDLPTNLDAELNKNNTSKSLIKSAVLTSLKMQILDGYYEDSVNYDNFKDISEIYVYIKHANIGQELVAQKAFNPDVRNRILNLDILSSELKPYLQQENFRMLFKFKKRRQMHNIMPFTIIGKFHITADPLN